MRIRNIGIWIAGAAAGAVSGLFGAGGGMVLVPALGTMTDLGEDEIFPASVSIILPICLICLFFSDPAPNQVLLNALPYLFGSAAGGVLAGLYGNKIPTLWLHRFLGVLILWGGFRNLW